jgi:hypothetical protein
LIRKTLLVLCLGLLLGSLPAAAFDLNLTAGVDFSGEIGDEDSVDTSDGYSLGLELAFDIPMLEVGVGAEYGFGRSVSLADDDLEYTQLYAFARLGILGPVYVTARAGYADLSGLTDLDGGESWSVGGGVDLLDKVKVEVLLNSFSADLSGLDVDYETYSAHLVYTF